MVKRIWFILIVVLLSMVGSSEAQVTQGTVFSKTEDGNGNKITSTVSGPSRGLDVSVIAGGAGATYLDADAIVNQTVSAVHGQTYMYNGATWDRVRGTIAGGLQVNCITGCAGGASTPTDAFANPTTAELSQTFNMVYNGATWDRLRGTVAGGALVNVSNASLAVTGTFFQVTQPVSGTVAATQSGVWSTGRTWTLASGTDSVTVTDGAGALNVIVDSGTLTAVTNITNPVTVTDGAGALNVIVDSGTLTAVTSITNTVTVAGNKTNNNAAPGATNVGVLPCIATAAAPTYVEGNQVGCSTLLTGSTRVDVIAALPTGANVIGALTANQSVNLAQVAGTATVNGGLAGSLAIGGTAANNAAITQNPDLIGAEVITEGTQPTAATTGNQRRLLASTEGSLYVTPYSANRFSCFVQAVTVTTLCQAIPAAGLRNYITSVSISNQAATVQGVDIVFGTGANCVTGITALTHKWQFGTLALTTSPMSVSQTFPTPLRPTAATGVCLRPTAATAFGATITGYIAP